MSKQIHINKQFDYHYIVIGIASHEHIWKLCWEINKQLSISLKKQYIEYEQGTVPPSKPPNTQSLFSKEPTYFEDSAYYEDTESHPRTEFALFRPTVSLKTLEAFGYIFLIRSNTDSIPDISSFLQQLNQVSAVISAVDISDIKNVNKIIP